ncbi:MAG: HAD hydrolase-like protein [Bacteroidales bacterium]|nr:HAD hydrolase-like protein [Bacteroidales bacterium]
MILFTDLDNTLYNWVDYFAPSFRAMVHALSPKFGITEEEFINELREVYKTKGTLEYLPILQGIKFFQNLSIKKQDEYLQLAKVAFGRARKKNLLAYDGVEQTLKKLSESGVIIIAVTNAPRYDGEKRLIRLGLDKYFYGLAAWEGKELPPNFKISSSISKHIQKRWEFSKEELKPNPLAYLKVISEFSVSHKSSYVIGDSISKDLNPAKEIGAVTIWAKYGTYFEQKNFETLLKITHWDTKDVKSTYDEKPIEPDYIVDSFTELNKIINPPQLKLFN